MKRRLAICTAGVVATIAGFAIPVLSQSPGPMAKLDGDTFFERRAEDVDVSGLVVRGIMIEHEIERTLANDLAFRCQQPR